MVKVLHLENPTPASADYFCNKELTDLQHEGKTILSVNTVVGKHNDFLTTILYDDPFDI